MMMMMKRSTHASGRGMHDLHGGKEQTQQTSWPTITKRCSKRGKTKRSVTFGQ